MMRSLSFFVLLLCACTSPDKLRLDNSTLIDTVVIDTIIPKIDTSKLIAIEREYSKIDTNHKVFIHILPSKEWIDSMQILDGEDGWNIVVNDNEYYIDIAKKYLISKGYSEIGEPLGTIWKLEGKEDIIKEINPDTLEDKWGLIIFDGEHNPFYYDGTEPGEDLK